jgi:hypothetical protein
LIAAEVYGRARARSQDRTATPTLSDPQRKSLIKVTVKPLVRRRAAGVATRLERVAGLGVLRHDAASSGWPPMRERAEPGSRPSRRIA